MKVKLSKTTFSSAEFKVASSVLKSGWLTHGEYNKKFENLFKKLTKTKYALTLNSCTSALELAIKCQNIIRGNCPIVYLGIFCQRNNHLWC